MWPRKVFSPSCQEELATEMKKQRHESTSPLQQQYKRGEKRRTGRTTTTAATNRTTGSSTMDTGTRRRRPFSSFFKGWSTRLVQTNTTTSFKRGTINTYPGKIRLPTNTLNQGIFPPTINTTSVVINPSLDFISKWDERRRYSSYGERSQRTNSRKISPWKVERRHETKIFSDLPLKGDTEEKIDDRVLLP